MIGCMLQSSSLSKAKVQKASFAAKPYNMGASILEVVVQLSERTSYD